MNISNIKNVWKFRLILRADSKIIEELRMNFVSVFKKYLLEKIYFYLVLFFTIFTFPEGSSLKIPHVRYIYI